MKFLRSIVSVSLALMVLVSSSSFVVNMHFCGGQIQSVTLIEEAAPCPMEVNLPPCHRNMAKQMNDCCEDGHLAFEGKDFNYSFKALNEVVVLAAGFVAELPFIMEVIQVNEALTASNYIPYKPPIVERDIPVLVQSFLI